MTSILKHHNHYTTIICRLSATHSDQHWFFVSQKYTYKSSWTMTYGQTTHNITSQQSAMKSHLSLKLLDLSSHIRRGRAGSQHLLQLENLGDTVNHLLDQLDLRQTKSLLVGHVELAAHSRGMLAGRTSGLKVEGRAHFLEQLLVLLDITFHESVELLELDHDGSTETSSKIGRASPKVSEILRPHKLGVVGLSRLLDSLRKSAEASEDRGDVTSHLHGDDAAMIFLVHPAESSLGLVVEDTSVVGPRAGSTGTS
mmetsp:Transcript_8743/g.14873  ORF Transcript_8743/g.14873 Transcript_8743/m.14873 type:complete len:255 (-) Transcript_8743:794-1558(-)